MKIISRKGWGARTARPGGQLVPASARREFIVHHSGGPADQSVRAIQDHCMDARGFRDIDYNLLVRGTTGEIYVGRGWNVIGSHARGHNTVGLGVCVIGTDTLSEAARESLRWIYRRAVLMSGRPLTVLGHRDVDATDCPGDGIYRWIKSGAVLHTTAPAAGHRLLYLTSPHMRGPDVRAVQLKIRAEPDGIFGPMTDAKVKLWQDAHGLVPDGIVGPKTRAKMGIN